MTFPPPEKSPKGRQKPQVSGFPFRLLVLLYRCFRRSSSIRSASVSACRCIFSGRGVASRFACACLGRFDGQGCMWYTCWQNFDGCKKDSRTDEKGTYWVCVDAHGRNCSHARRSVLDGRFDLGRDWLLHDCECKIKNQPRAQPNRGTRLCSEEAERQAEIEKQSIARSAGKSGAAKQNRGKEIRKPAVSGGLLATFPAAEKSLRPQAEYPANS